MGNEKIFKFDPAEELKLAQQVVTTQEILCFRIFGWAIGIVTALTIGFFHESVKLDPVVYMPSGIIMVCVFYWVARRHWSIFYSATMRSHEIENEINTNSYLKFKLNESLTIYKDDISPYESIRHILPYIALGLIIFICGISKILPAAG